jgi:hypothetical protein
MMPHWNCLRTTSGETLVGFEEVAQLLEIKLTGKKCMGKESVDQRRSGDSATRRG